MIKSKLNTAPYRETPACSSRRSMRQDLEPNLLDKYETVSGSVRHRRGFGTRSTKSDTKFDSEIFWNHNVSEFSTNVPEGVCTPSARIPAHSCLLRGKDRSIYKGVHTRGCVDALWVIEAHQSAWQLSYWIQNAIFQVSTFRGIPHHRQTASPSFPPRPPPRRPPPSAASRIRQEGLRVYMCVCVCVVIESTRGFRDAYGDRALSHLSRRPRSHPLRRVMLFHACGPHLCAEVPRASS